MAPESISIFSEIVIFGGKHAVLELTHVQLATLLSGTCDFTLHRISGADAKIP
jgi:hypothetical protein